jgi:hypothetical protein
MEQLSFLQDTEIEYSPLPLNIYGKGMKINPYRITRNECLQELLPLEEYDYILVGYSGGKDCTAAVLYLLELGVPKNKIVLLHHCIDGKDDTNSLLQMDWPCTRSYCQQFADVMGLNIKYSWREEGFAGELLRLGSSNPISFQEFNSDELKITTTVTWEKTKDLKSSLDEAKKNNNYEKQEEILTELKILGYR